MDFLKNIFGDKALTYAELEAALIVKIYVSSTMLLLTKSKCTSAK